MIRPVGLVLAGGAGTRMGGPKGSLAFRGMTLAQRAAHTLRPLCDRLYVSVATGAAATILDATPIEDPPPAGRGPLAGLAAALAATGAADLMVLACDYPFVETSFCREILAAADRAPEIDVTFPFDSSGRDHPLVGVWRARTGTAIGAALKRGELSVRGVVGVVRILRLGARDFGLPDIDRVLANWNEPADLSRSGVTP